MTCVTRITYTYIGPLTSHYQFSRNLCDRSYNYIRKFVVINGFQSSISSASDSRSRNSKVKSNHYNGRKSLSSYSS